MYQKYIDKKFEITLPSWLNIKFYNYILYCFINVSWQADRPTRCSFRVAAFLNIKENMLKLSLLS